MAPFFSRRISKQDKPRENAGTNEKPLPAPPRAASFNFRSSKRDKEKTSLDAKTAQHGRESSAISLVTPSHGIENEVHTADNALSSLDIGSKNDNDNNNNIHNGGPSSSATSIRPSSSAFRPRSVSPNKSARGPSTPDLSQRSSMVASYGGLSAVEEGGEGHGHYVPVQASWSSMAEDDLINNLGPRERGRQEVLWEIVSSEERYVQDLVKLVDTFASALLPASSTTPTLTLDDPIASLMRTLSPRPSFSASPAPGSPVNSQASPALPIAAQFARSRQGSLFDDPSSPIAHAGAGADARMDAYHKLTNGRPGVGGSKTSVNQAGLAGSGNGNGSGSGNAGLGMGMGIGSIRPGMTSRASLPGPARRQNSFTGSVRNASAPSMLGQAELPEELKAVLQTIAQGILPGHVKLAAALRRRYENQYPLVRSLADVFTAHSSILREYATYVLHLERALEAIDTALLAYQSTAKRLSYTRNRDKALVELGKTLWHVDQVAASKAETGLAISLSKPFQRLLKYPLLFQNLLFNTDPSLKEYEATLAMVDEVEAIVRGIEDEKTSQEERNKARDGWARIDGIDVKELMVPKPNRMLVSESRAMSDMPDVQALSKSRHRLSDILKKQDPVEYWTVKFSDVTLLCEKTGITHLPLSGTNQLAGMDGKARKRASMQRSQSVRARNLYKFCKIMEWAELPRHEGSASGPAASSQTPSSAASATASRASLARVTQSPPATPQKRPTATASPLSGPDATPKHTPLRVPLKTNDGPSTTPAASTFKRPVDADASTVVSDRQSVMSFAFKGGDQLKPARIRARPASGASPRTGASTGEGSAGANGKTAPALNGNHRGQKDGEAKAVPPPSRPTSYSTRAPGGHVQTKAAAAKFAHRLRPIEGLDTALPGEHHGETADARGPGLGQGQQQSERAMRMVSVRSSLPPAMRQAEVAQRQAAAQTAVKSAPGEDERRARMSTPPVVGVSSRLLAPTAASAARSVTSSRRVAPKGRGGMI